MQKIVYISGAITGTDDYMERFEKASKMLEEKGYMVINPALTISTLPNCLSYYQNMKVCILLLDMCDAIYFLDGWKCSVGANSELKVAAMKGLDLMFESDGDVDAVSEY